MYQNSVYENIIDVCKASRTNRAQSYVNADTSSYIPNQQISFSFPNVLMDNTDAYLEATCTFTNIVAPLPRIQTLTFPSPLGSFNTNSYFRLSYAGYSTAPLIINQLWANAIDMPVGVGNQNLEDFLNALEGPSKEFAPYTVVATIPGSKIVVGGNQFVITFSLGQSPGSFLADSFEIIDDNIRLGADLVGFPIGGNATTPPTGRVPGVPLSINYPTTPTSPILYQDPTLGYPRLERFAPLIQIARVDFDSTNVINLNNCMVLQSSDMLMECIDSYTSNYWVHNDLEDGYYNSGSFRIKIHLKYIQLLHSILPLGSLNAIVKVYFTTSFANQALIQSASNQSFILSDVRWNYHRIILNGDEKIKLDNQVRGDGMVIPFYNWSDFTIEINSGISQQNVIFNPACSNLLGVMFSFLDLPYTQDSSHKRKFSTFLNNYIVNYRLKINEKYYPLNIVNTIDGTDLLEPIEELTRFINMYKRYDYEEGQSPKLFIAYTVFGQQDLASAQIYNSQFDQTFNQSSIMAISCADVGYQGPYEKCVFMNQALNGVNTSNVTNVILELQGMSPINGNTLYIYSLHQDYLIIKGNGFEWIK